MISMIKKMSASLLLVPALVLGIGLFAPAVPAAQAACDPGTGLGGALGDDGCVQEAAEGSGMQMGDLFGGSDSIIRNVINIMLFIVGILSVIMVIWGGISYVLSRGDPEKVKNSKNIILYSVVGLIIAIIAFALVNWVFEVLGGS